MKNDKEQPETVEVAAINNLIKIDFERLFKNNNSRSDAYINGARFGANWQARQHGYTEQPESVDQAANEYESLSGGLGSATDDFKSGAKWQAEQYAITNSNPTYTQEQMLAFGECVKKECVEHVEAITETNGETSEFMGINYDSILNIDISKLLNK